MMKVEAIIKPFKLDDVKAGLTALGVGGMRVGHVPGSGHQPIHAGSYGGATYTIDFVPKMKVEVVVADRRWPSS